MMPKSPIESFEFSNVLNPEWLHHIKRCEKNKPWSLYTPVTMLLYVGSTTVLAAASVLIYKHFEQIGHEALLISLFVLCFIGLSFCFINRHRFESVVWFDFLLSSCAVLLSIATAYLQFQFKVFGQWHWLAFLVPAFFQLFLAYYFDDVAVLSLAISNIAAAIGIKFAFVAGYLLSPFEHTGVFYCAMVLGACLYAIGYYHQQKKFFAHFAFCYYNIGFHLISLALVSLENLHLHLLWYIMLLAALYFTFHLALKLKSFAMYIFIVLYAYAGTTVFIINSIGFHSGYIAMMYFIATAIMAIKYIRDYRHKFGIK